MGNIEKQPSIIDFLRLMIANAGTQARYMKRAIFLTFVTAVLRGFVYLMFIPIFTTILNNNYKQTMVYFAVLRGLWMLSSFSEWISRGYDFNGQGSRAVDEMRREMGNRLRQIPMQKLYAKRTGEITADFAGNIDLAMDHSILVTYHLMKSIVIPIVVGLGVMYYDWRLGLAILVVFPLIVPIYMWIKPKLSANQKEYVDATNVLNAETLEYVQGLPVLKAANALDKKSTRFHMATEAVREQQKVTVNKEAPTNMLLASITEIGMLLALAYGLWLLDSDAISIMVLAAVMVAMIRFAEPLSEFLSMMSILNLMSSVFKRLQYFSEMETLPQVTPLQTPDRFDVRFDNVSFRYDNSDDLALRHINLEIKANSLTALVGSSGCGKTTLTRMLRRFADPQSGLVSIGGVNVQQICPETLNSLIAVVFQDVYLFDDTVFANIKMGCASASDEEVYAAAKAAHCHEFIKRLPEGYQTKVVDIGGNLSGGEKQRISIARALLKNAPIVVLDEPTAALDTESEVVVQKAIDTLVKNKTVIVIAHRLSTIVAAKQIVVMHDGEIVETGTHQQLLDKQGRYHQLWMVGRKLAG